MEEETELNVNRITVYRTWMVDYQYATPENLPSNWSEMRAVEQDSWLRKHGFLLDTKFKEYLGVDDGTILVDEPTTSKVVQ